MKSMNTLITMIKFTAEGNIPSQIELMGNPIYENGKIKTFEVVKEDYNYNEKDSLDYSIENFNMSVVGLSDCTFNFIGYFTFTVLEEGKAEFDLCVTVENIHDNLIDDIDTLFTSNNILIGDFIFKDDCYLFELGMKVTEIIKTEIHDIY